MGIFSSTKIFVSSVVYNLAGAEEGRSDFLKSLVQGNIISATNFDITETLQSGYMKGPGIRLRNFFNWAQDNYDYVGLPKGGFFSSFDIDNDIVIANIPHDLGATVTLSEVVIAGADNYYFADRWMLENYPDQENDDLWTSDYDDVTGEIVVTLADLSVHRFIDPDFDQRADYLYATYDVSTPGTVGPVVPGTPVDLGTSGPFPSTTGWTLVSSVSTPRTMTLYTVTDVNSTFSDARPPTSSSSSTSTSGSWTEIQEVYEKTEYQGQDPLVDRTWSLRSIMNRSQLAHAEGSVISTTTNTVSIGGGVTRTDVTTVTEDSIVLDREYRTDTQDITVSSFEGPKMFIYKLLSGIPAIDDAIEKTTPDEQYYPFIPARLDNKMVDETHFPALYPIAKKAYKKSTAGKFDTFIEKIADNEKIDDIDYVYCVFGVSANVVERDCREYMYRFFKSLGDNQTYNSTTYNSWKGMVSTAASENALWKEWKAAQNTPLDPLYGTPEPTVGKFASIPTNEVRINSDGNGPENLNYDIRISWQSIEEDSGTGLLEPGRKRGEIWWTSKGTEVFPTTLKREVNTRTVAVDKMELNWQVDANNWKRLTIIGAVHRNYIYKGKFVEIGLLVAIADVEESGFILPLHKNIYHSMPLTKSTQMATACCFAVLNVYVVKKTGFFGSFFFKVILFVVVIAVSIYFPPAAGLLGSNAAVGAALGFSGLAGLVVGAVANLIAASLLLKIIGTVATVVFGAKIGSIIGAIAGFVAITVGAGMLNGQSFSSAIGQLSNIKNIMGLASSVGTGVQGYVQASISDMNKQLEVLQDEAKAKQAGLKSLYAENIGYGRGQFNAMALTDYVPLTPERPSVFLARTQMVGSDNIALQLAFIRDFAEITLATDLP